MEIERTIRLKSSDGEVVELSRKCCLRSGLLKGIIEDFPDDSEFPLNDVNAMTLLSVKSYLEHYENNEPSVIERPLKSKNFAECVNEWDYEFLGEDTNKILNLIMAANYMDIKPLLELACAKIGSKIMGITTEAIKKEFDLDGIFTKEEEDLILMDKAYLEENL